MTESALDLVEVRVILGGHVVVDDVTLSFERGVTHAIVGRSGAGKSVLMKAAASLLPIAHGSVRVHAPPLVFVHQDPALLDTLDVRENVAFAVTRLAKDDVDARVDEAMRALGITELARKSPGALSIAAQKRVALARALALRPGVLVVDEPTTGLDPVAARQVDDALARLIAPDGRGTPSGALALASPPAHRSDTLVAAHAAPSPEPATTLIVITHSPRTLARLQPRVVVIEGGRAHERSAA